MNDTPQEYPPNPDSSGPDLSPPSSRHPQEKSPGVYVRQSDERQAQGEGGHDELDLLWASNSPAKVTLNKEERHPVFMFVAGLGTGVLVTLLAFVVFVNRPLPPGPNHAPKSGNPLTAPIERLQSAVLQGRELPEGTVEHSAQGRTSSRVAVPDHPVEDSEVGAENPSAQSETGGQVHEVASGDTLGSIASKYYDDTSPSLIDKIQRANNMNNPNDLSIGQKLVIPPKSY